MPRKKTVKLSPSDLFKTLQQLGAPSRLMFLAIGTSFDGVWRAATVEEKAWLFRAIGRDDDVDLLLSEGSLAGIDNLYSVPPAPIEPAAPEPPMVMPCPMEMKPPQKQKPWVKRASWQRQERPGRKEPSTWVPPHMRRKKST